MELVPGGETSDRNRTRYPGAASFVTVRFTEIETAPGGMPHGEVDTSNVRVAAGCSAGPPSGPVALRVSRTRHGGSA